MYEHLKGKTLLVMDRTALAACAVTRAKEMGIKTVVANFYKTEDSPSKQVADVAIDIDISDIDAMVALVKQYHIDGIFVGWTDSHLPFYAEICEKAGLPCCGTLEQFGTLSNDKSKFKALCEKYGVPSVPEYKIDIRFLRDDLDKIKYPVIVKPTDGSGSRGVKCCQNEEELKEHYSFLYHSEKNKNIICEEYIGTQKEIFLNYIIQNGECSLTATYMSFNSKNEDGSKGPAILHIYPSSYTKAYRDTVEPLVIEMFQGFGLKNAFISLQGFVTDRGFLFHETGLRMGGGQSYVFTQAINGISSLDLMIEYALTGSMSSVNALKNDNPFFDKFCANYYISLRKGTITRIDGIEEVNSFPQVLQNKQFKFVGETITPTNSLDRVCFRIHVMDDTKESLAHTLCRISDTIKILDEDGNDMQLQRLRYDDVLRVINDA